MLHVNYARLLRVLYPSLITVVFERASSFCSPILPLPVHSPPSLSPHFIAILPLPRRISYSPPFAGRLALAADLLSFDRERPSRMAKGRFARAIGKSSIKVDGSGALPRALTNDADARQCLVSGSTGLIVESVGDFQRFGWSRRVSRSCSRFSSAN